MRYPSRNLHARHPVLAAFLAAVVLLGAGPVPAQDDALEAARDLRYREPQAAIERLDEAIGSLAPEDDRARLAELLKLRAEIARDLGRLEAAAADAERFQELAGPMGDRRLEAEALHARGTIAAEGGDVTRAIEHFHRARQLLEPLDAPGQLARVLMAIGIAHSFIDDYERSREYNNRALPLARQARDKELEARVLGNLAIDASKLEGPGASLERHRQSLELSRELDDTRGIAYQLANICDRLVELGRLDEADDTCLEAVNRLERLGHPRVLAGARMTLGDLRLEQHRPGEALAHYREALRAAEGEVPVVEREVLGKLADFHEDRGEHARALDYRKRLGELRREKFEQEEQDRIQELETRYEVEQREREIEMLELESELQEAKLERRTWMLAGAGAALVLSMLLALVAWRAYRTKAALERTLADRNRELEEALATISELARQDPLTGLYNRRAFRDVVAHDLARARRGERPLVLAMGDIDNFKPLNDEHGHAVGDAVLQAVAERLQEHVREADVVCRWGGEEFLVLLPDTDLATARSVIQRVREGLAEKPIPTDAGKFTVALTFGIAPLTDDLDAAIRSADQAMYEGKRAGRDRVVVHGGT